MGRLQFAVKFFRSVERLKWGVYSLRLSSLEALSV